MSREESLHQKTWRGLGLLNFLFDECVEVPAEVILHLFRLLFKGQIIKYAMLNAVCSEKRRACNAKQRFALFISYCALFVVMAP